MQLRHTVAPLDDRYAAAKGRDRPPQLTETRTTVGNQRQLRKERLVAARLSSLVNRSAVLVTGVRVPDLVNRPPHRPQLFSKSCRGCTGPCFGTSSVYRARDPSRKRLRRGRR